MQVMVVLQDSDQSLQLVVEREVEIIHKLMELMELQVDLGVEEHIITQKVEMELVVKVTLVVLELRIQTLEVAVEVLVTQVVLVQEIVITVVVVIVVVVMVLLVQSLVVV